jgi:hypothetical protein
MIRNVADCGRPDHASSPGSKPPRITSPKKMTFDFSTSSQMLSEAQLHAHARSASKDSAIVKKTIQRDRRDKNPMCGNLAKAKSMNNYFRRLTKICTSLQIAARKLRP